MDESLPEGTIVANYKIEEKLGKGGQGIVYLAEDMKLKRRVALKILSADTITDEDRLKRFIDEACSASHLNHQNILTIHHYGTADNVHYIDAEFIDGETLRKRIQREELQLREALDIAIQVATALHAAHTANIVHCDIKPENIMIRHDDDVVKVLDYGIAKLTQYDPSEQTTEKIQTGSPVAGTIHYMSPEQLKGRRIDRRTDIWSLGVVLYEMVTGYRPFPRLPEHDVREAILNFDPPALSHYASNAPDELQQIIDKALQKDRKERYQDVQDMALSLKALRQQLDGPTATISSPLLNTLSNNKLPLRRAQIVFLALVGMALGFACGMVAGKYVWGKDDNVRIVGGGTVYYYLTSLDPNLFKNLSDSTYLNVLPVQTPTGLGAQIFAHNFGPTTDQPNLLNITILVMASRQLKIEDLSRPVSGPSKTRPRAVFEVYLGADPLQVLLVAGDADAKDASGAILNKDFRDIMSTKSVQEGGALKFTDLATILNSSNNKAHVYMGGATSGTRCLWKTLLIDSNGKNYSLGQSEAWDIQDVNSINQRSGEPGIYFGSQVLVDEEIRRRINNHHLPLTMVDESNNQVKRGLYLYGFLDNVSEANKTHDKKGYKLPRHVTEILNHVFDLLERKSTLISKGCIAEQRKYFNLKEEVGWVGVMSDNTTVYRADGCTERPMEPASTCDEESRK